MDWVLLRNQWSQKYVSAVNGKPMQAKLSKGPGINSEIQTLAPNCELINTVTIFGGLV